MSDTEQREKLREDAVAKFGAEEFARLEKFAATLVRKPKDRPTEPNHVKTVKKIDIMYTLKGEQEFLWIE
jgi:hypothetical protein